MTRPVLVWTDCYGPTAADKWDNLVNDFDLYVSHEVQPPWMILYPDWYIGNHMDGQWSTKLEYKHWTLPMLRSHAGDTANNVEVVHLPASSLTTGQQVTVWIRNWVLAGDGIAQDPGASGRQDFALILCNVDT